jgi:uncharacterized protein involved in exopolysaccharide biosynthesis
LSNADSTLTRVGDAHSGETDYPLLAFGALLLRWRRALLALAALGAVSGAISGLASPRLFEAVATFIPQGSEGGGAASGLELAASEFGIRVPSGGAFGPPVYVELLRSRALLEPVALDTFDVREESRRAELRELLGVTSKVSDASLGAIRRAVTANEVKALGGVRLTVRTQWPSVSLAATQALLRRINDFNLRTRRTQAAAERQFVEAQSVEAERTLRDAEDRLQAFVQRNRSTAASPELAFERDRLQRAVNLAQNAYTSLVVRKVEARIKEVRDTPLITVLEEPQLPRIAVSRRVLLRTVLGSAAGVALALILAWGAAALNAARDSGSRDASVFFDLLRKAVPEPVWQRILGLYRRTKSTDR